MIYPKISIITPSFNQASYIERTIDSVLSQGYPNLEYIIMDGGSTDGSVDIIRRHEKYLTYWRSEKDRGQSHAINSGLERATGEIENWLNSDDELAPGALEAIGSYFEEHPSDDILVGQRMVIDTESNPLAFHHYCPWNMYWDMLAYLFYPAQESTFWRSALRKRVGLLRENLHYSMDYEWFLRLSAIGSVAVTHRYLGKIRSHPDQKGNSRDESGEDLFSVRKEYLEALNRRSLFNRIKIRSYRILRRCATSRPPFSWSPPLPEFLSSDSV